MVVDSISAGVMSPQVYGVFAKNQQKINNPVVTQNTLERSPQSDKFEKKGLSTGAKVLIGAGALATAVLAIRCGKGIKNLEAFKKFELGKVNQCDSLGFTDLLKSIKEKSLKLELKETDKLEAHIFSPKMLDEVYELSKGPRPSNLSKKAYAYAISVNDHVKHFEVFNPKELLDDIVDIVPPEFDKLYKIPIEL